MTYVMYKARKYKIFETFKSCKFELDLSKYKNLNLKTFKGGKFEFEFQGFLRI